MSTEVADADKCCATCGVRLGKNRGKGLELRDKVLFTPPEGSHLGECPICCLPLSLDQSKSVTMTCCSKVICRGCDYANQRREDEAGLEKRCAFCREPLPKSQEEINKRCKKRMKKNDPVAIYQMGNSRLQKGDYKTAFEYFAKAAELGDTQAHYTLSVMYNDGEGVEKDGEKRIYHLEEAAIGGHADARFNLGIEEWKNGRYERAAKHFIIAANLGDHESLQELKELYADGHASKEDYAGALRAYQSAIDATKSTARKKAEEALKNGDMIIRDD